MVGGKFTSTTACAITQRHSFYAIENISLKNRQAYLENDPDNWMFTIPPAPTKYRFLLHHSVELRGFVQGHGVDFQARLGIETQLY